MERRIFSIHAKISGETKEDIEEMYVSIAQGLQTFGATIFTAKVAFCFVALQCNTTNRKLSKSGEGSSMGVAEDGILIPSESNPVRASAQISVLTRLIFDTREIENI